MLVILLVWLWFHCYVSLCYCLEWYYKHIDFGAAKFSHASLSGYPFRCICFFAKNVVFWNYAISSLFSFDSSFFYIIVWIFYFIRRISNFFLYLFLSVCCCFDSKHFSTLNFDLSFLAIFDLFFFLFIF